VHTAAVVDLNQRLASSRGRGNSLYILLYYLGGSAGITASGTAYHLWGGRVVALVACFLAVPFGAGLSAARDGRRGGR
jgi:YNFM family putative membrane transporter